MNVRGIEKPDTFHIKADWRWTHIFASIITAAVVMGMTPFAVTLTEIHTFNKWVVTAMTVPVILSGLWTMISGHWQPKEVRPRRPAFSRPMLLLVAVVITVMTATVSFGVMSANQYNINLTHFEVGPGAWLVLIPMAAYAAMLYNLSTLSSKWNRNKAIAWLIVGWVVSMWGPLLWEGYKVAVDYGLLH